MFHPGGRFVYVINEMGSSVTPFTYDAEKAVLHPMQTVSTLPAGLKAKLTLLQERRFGNGTVFLRYEV